MRAGYSNKGKQMRKLTLIALAALAVMTSIAYSAPAAGAATGTVSASAGATNYISTQIGAGLTFTMPGSRVLSCSTAQFSGALINGATELTASPTYDVCQVKVGEITLPATVNLFACDYRYRDLTNVSPETWSAITELACPEGQAIRILVYSNHSNHTSGTRLCEYSLFPQTLIAGVHFQDLTNNTFEVETSEFLVATKRTFGTLANCGEESGISKWNGTVLGMATMGTVALDDELTPPKQVGKITSSGSSSYTGTQAGGGLELKLNGARVLKCTTPTISGTLGGEEFKSKPTYLGCDATIGATTLPATIDMAECFYRFHGLTSTASDTWSASTDLICPLGKPVRITVYLNHAEHTAGVPLCEYTIHAQMGLTGLQFTDTTNGKLDIKPGSFGLHTTRAFGKVANCGVATFASTLNSEILLEAASGALSID